MPTFAEYAQVPSGTPVVGLQGVIQKAYEKKPFGRGHFQNALAADNAGGQMMIQVVDGPDLYEGMPFQASAHQGKVNGQPVWEDCYVEDYNGKRRITIKRKCFTILAGVQPPAQPGPSGQLWPGGPGVPAQSPALAPGGPLGPAYGQAQAAPLPGAYLIQPQTGQPGAFPAQPGRRPDPEWGAGAGLAGSQPGHFASGMNVVGQQTSAPAWQPKPKKTVAEARQFLLDQFAELAEAVGREWAASAGQSAGAAVPLGQLPPEVVAGIMSWVTHISIGVERDDVVADSPAAVPSGGGGEALMPEVLDEGDTSIPF